MIELLHNYIHERTAVKMAEEVENLVKAGKLRPGDRLPSVRELAKDLNVSPATVSAVYKKLNARGIVYSRGRGGTFISPHPLPLLPRGMPVNQQLRNLADGNPDPELFPPLKPILEKIDPSPVLYGVPDRNEDLMALLEKRWREEDVSVGDYCVVNGALDGMERVFKEFLRPGDRVLVEDPGFVNVFHLATSMGLVFMPVEIDQEGMLPGALEKACHSGAEAIVITPRAQSPTGAALSAERAEQLKAVLKKYPDIFLIEDDHASWITDAKLYPLHSPDRDKWVYIHSLAKALNPDLRIAFMTGDDASISRVRERLITGERWVSHLLQRMVLEMISDADVLAYLDKVTNTYKQRRISLLDALKAQGIEAMGRSSFNVWIPVPEEVSVVNALAQKGWAVSAGERFRISSPPAIRVTTATITPTEAHQFAQDLYDVLLGGRYLSQV